MSKPRTTLFQRLEMADPLQLQPRDIRVLRDVGEFRFLNTPQILALHQGGERNLLRRLSSLFQHGYLECRLLNGQPHLNIKRTVFVEVLEVKVFSKKLNQL